jgi:hypothetical protein
MHFLPTKQLPSLLSLPRCQRRPGSNLRPCEHESTVLPPRYRRWPPLAAAGRRWPPLATAGSVTTYSKSDDLVEKHDGGHVEVEDEILKHNGTTVALTPKQHL